MGADFTFATFPYFDMTEDRRERFRELIMNLPTSETNEFLEWYGLDEDDCFHNDLCSIPNNLLEDIETACSVRNRETSTLTTYNDKGEKYELNVTGGMSWGESPTDAYDTFNRAGFFEDVYNLAIDFSVEYIKMYA
jgi:hypothetical protein